MIKFFAQYGYIIATVLLLPAFIFAIAAQAKVTRTFNTFKRLPATNGKTAREVAEEMLNNAGVKDCKVQKISGELTDNFNPKTKVVSLSESVYDSNSIASIGVAAHEVGHAIQYNKGYFPMKIRQLTIIASNITSSMLMPLLIIGLIFNYFFAYVGLWIIFIGLLSYFLAFLANLVTLPVEFNASKRALKILQTDGHLTPTETNQARRVLNAAAMTYVASSLIAILQFLRIVFLIFGSSSKRK